jgi:hypothetical protein
LTDLIYYFHKIHTICDEMFLGGEVQETSKSRILARLAYLERLDKDEKNGVAEMHQRSYEGKKASPSR